MQITFQLTPKDYYDGYLVWRGRKPWRRWLFWCAYVVVALTIPLAVLLAFLIHDAQNLELSAGILVFAAVWFAFMLGAPRLSARRQFRGTPSAHNPMTVEVSDAGLRVRTALGESQVAWPAYVGWSEDKSIFVLFPTPRIYIPVPKRAFSDEQVAEFRETLRRNIGSK